MQPEFDPGVFAQMRVFLPVAVFGYCVAHGFMEWVLDLVRGIAGGLGE